MTRNKKNPFLIPRFEDKTDNQISDFSYGQEVTETFLVGNVSSLWLGKVVSLSKYKFFLISLILIFIILFSRLLYLQLIQGDKFQALAEGNRSRLEAILPSRGVIFDYLGVPLVSNVPTFTLFLNSGELKIHTEEKEKIISILTDKKILLPEEITALMEKDGYLPIPIKENVPYETALDLELATTGLSSLKITVDPQRHYQENLSLAHLLGYLSRITQEGKDEYLEKGYSLTEKIGYSGLESYYQDLLRGIPGKRQIEVDSLGREKKIIAEQTPIAGGNIFLNIDAGLQAKIVEVL